MKSGKPKGKEPCLIGGSLGSPRPATAERVRECNRCKGDIPKGTGCFEIAQLGSSFTAHRSYCSECFKRILTKTKEKLSELEAMLA